MTENLFIRNKNNIALIVATYQPNEKASKLLRVCIDSFLKINRNNLSLWVVDVGSPSHKNLVRPDDYSEVNFILSDHIPRSWSGIPFRKKIISKLLLKKKPRNGSFANGWTLNLAHKIFQEINYNPEYLMTLQSDIIFTKKTIIEELLAMFDKETAAVGVREQLNYGKKVKILHSLGCLWKYKVLKSIGCDFMPNMPEWDVGEKLISKAFKFGYKTKSLECTFSNTDAFKKINDEEVRNLENIDRCLNENGEILFMHLGRGITNTKKGFSRKGLTIERWEEICNRLIECQI